MRMRLDAALFDGLTRRGGPRQAEAMKAASIHATAKLIPSQDGAEDVEALAEVVQARFFKAHALWIFHVVYNLFFKIEAHSLAFNSILKGECVI